MTGEDTDFALDYIAPPPGRHRHMRGAKHLSKSILIGLAAFSATSAFIVTFAISGMVQHTPVGAESAGGPPTTPRPYTPRYSTPTDTIDAGNGTQASSGASTPSSGSIAAVPGAPEGSPGVGIQIPVDTSKLDPALRSLLGDDVPNTVNDVVDTVDDTIPGRELIK
jgi:hypothetical protein